jgi:hypothetical protein
MKMKVLAGLIAFLFAANAFAQSAQPKVAAKPPMHGCKLVGTVKGTKLWAGDCMDAAALRGAEPTVETTPLSLPAEAGAAIPPGQKQ